MSSLGYVRIKNALRFDYKHITVRSITDLFDSPIIITLHENYISFMRSDIDSVNTNSLSKVSNCVYATTLKNKDINNYQFKTGHFEFDEVDSTEDEIIAYYS